jgi:deazaflavin-dependent oxidoreductase (nitroreductase family)
MPFPARMARVANRVVNPVTMTFAGYVPPFAIVIHKGRKTGAAHRNPVMAHAHGEEVVFALTYGSKVNWVRNTLAAGGCDIVRRGRRIGLVDPRLEEHDEPPPEFSRLQRPILERAGVHEYLRLRRVDRRDAA